MKSGLLHNLIKKLDELILEYEFELALEDKDSAKDDIRSKQLKERLQSSRDTYSQNKRIIFGI